MPHGFENLVASHHAADISHKQRYEIENLRFHLHGSAGPAKLSGVEVQFELAKFDLSLCVPRLGRFGDNSGHQFEPYGRNLEPYGRNLKTNFKRQMHLVNTVPPTLTCTGDLL